MQLFPLRLSLFLPKPCAGYVAYPFKNQEGNTFYKKPLRHLLMHTLSRKRMVEPSLALFLEQMHQVASTGLYDGENELLICFQTNEVQARGVG